MTWKSPRWLWLLLLLPLLGGLARLRFDVDVLNLLPADVPAVQGLKLQQQHFASSRELVVTLSAPDAERAESAAGSLAETLRQASSLVREVTWQPPWLEHPVQFAELIGYLWLNQTPEVFGDLTNRLAGTNALATLAATRARLATTFSPSELARLPHDPFDLMRLPESETDGPPALGQGQELFAAPDGVFRLLFVQAQSPLTNYRECARWIGALRALVQSWRESDPARRDLKIEFTGGAAFTAEIAGGMERDMTSSVLSTMAIIALLFWWAHRRWRPLLWLLCLVTFILAGTLALGGLVIGTLNVVSAGFAAILLGLAVDYGLVLYQEALAEPQATARAVRRALAPSICWSAVTTAGAFLILNWSGLPGLAQLGTLVAIGVTLAAVVMLYGFLPPLLRVGSTPARARDEAPAPSLKTGGPPGRAALPPAILRTTTVLIVVAAAAILWRGLPALDQTSEPLRPRRSRAYDALEEIKQRMGGHAEPYWLVIPGTNETEVAQRMDLAKPLLSLAQTNGQIARFELPQVLWPDAARQSANRMTARLLISQRDALRQAAGRSGFSTNALVMTEAILATWRSAAESSTVFWPSNDASRWLLDKVVVRAPGQSLALGLVYPAAAAGPVWPEQLSRELRRQGVLLAGWEALGAALLDVVKRDLWKVVLPIIALLGISLWLAFRRPTEVMLSLATLALSGLCLLALMKAVGWSWNLLNLMALPLLLGTGVDYSIHMQSALRRHGGDVALARRSTGRALWLCGGTTVAGFGSLVWSSNAGLASLGQVCAAGIACAMLVSIYLLPAWWGWSARGEGQSPSLKVSSFNAAGQPSGPSSLYRATFWKAGLLAARRLPESWGLALARKLGWVYWFLARHRREVVVQNLLPPLQGDQTAAERVARELFAQFAVKLVDLWRYESGLPVDRLFAELTGWEHFTSAHQRGEGVLLVTPHLGNWEFGGPLLIQRGIKLHVITLIEPGNGLTELRLASRARWGIETLVIGKDAFAVVEVIKRLEAGATVALLIDRPPAASAVTVELFGRPFQASIAAAELARASGCALVPVVLPRRGRSYAAHVLPEISYDRVALAKREARQELTHKILRAFEPAIREHLDQWYHFVPIWPDKRGTSA